MPTSTTAVQPRGLARVLGWRRLRVLLGSSFVLSLLMLPTWQASYALLISRLLLIGLLVLLVFGLFETRPKRLPPWLARWVLQVASVAVVMPFAAAIVYAF